MDKIKDKISTFGAFLSAAGVISCVLTFVNYEVRILMWINLWGPVVAWSIRIGLIVIGLIIFKVFKIKTDQPAIESFDWTGYYRAVLTDPLFVQFLADVNRQYQVSFQSVTDENTYQVAHLAYFNNIGQVIYPGANDLYLVNIYVERNHGNDLLLLGATFNNGSWGPVMPKTLSRSEWVGYIPAETQTIQLREMAQSLS